MRSSWSAERVLAVLAAASVEAAGLTLADLGIGWLGGRPESSIGVPAFAAAVLVGLAVARRLRRATWERYLLVMPAAAVLVGLVGGWLARAIAGAPDDPVAILATPATWLLGVGVLRGSAHAELDDEAYTLDRLLRIGMPGVAVFWILAAASGLPADPGATATAFGATLTFVSSALLGLGLGRLRELRVETMDQAARARWLALLFGVSGLVFLVGIPLAALLEVPLATVLAGASGPIGTLIVLVFVTLATPVILVLSAIADAIGPVVIHLDIPAFRVTGSGDGTGVPDGVVTVVVTVLGLLAAIDLLAVLIVVTAMLRRRRRRRASDALEVREAEPISLGLPVHLPHLRGRRPRIGTPANAVEAYRFALAALAGGDSERRLGETPREHATRVRGTEVGPSLARLAADYQLAALGGRRLTDREERRAQARWQQVRRSTR